MRRLLAVVFVLLLVPVLPVAAGQPVRVVAWLKLTTTLYGAAGPCIGHGEYLYRRYQFSNDATDAPTTAQDCERAVLRLYALFGPPASLAATGASLAPSLRQARTVARMVYQMRNAVSLYLEAAVAASTDGPTAGGHAAVILDALRGAYAADMDQGRCWLRTARDWHVPLGHD